MTKDQLLALDGGDLTAVLAALRGHVGEALEGVAKVNKSRLDTWTRQLADVAVGATEKFARGEMSAEQFDYVLDVQYMSLKNVLLYVENLPLVAAQAAVNAAFTVLGYAVRNATGLDLVPELTGH